MCELPSGGSASCPTLLSGMIMQGHSPGERQLLTAEDDDGLEADFENYSVPAHSHPQGLAGTSSDHAEARSSKWSPWEILLTFATCAVYMLVGPLLIMSNKYLLTTGHFHYPIMLTAVHQTSSSVCSAILVRCFRVVPLAHEVTWSLWWRNIFLVGAATTAALCTGTSSYLYLTVAFIEILKGFTPVVTMMVQALFGEPLPECKILAAVLMISLGTAISSYGELNLNLTGLVLMLVSVYCEATRLLLTQRLLNNLNFHVIEGLYYMSPASAISAWAVAAVVELPRFPYRRFINNFPLTWHLFLGNALLGFLVNVVSFLVIKRTNVVMLKLLAISRNAFVVFAGIMLFGDVVGEVQFVGYAVSLVFFVAYNVLLLRRS